MRSTSALAGITGFMRGPAIGAAEGVGAGIVVGVVAFLLARYGPAGGDWSFRGNGALAAYALIPAFLAGGWTATALRYRERPPVAGAFAAATVGVALAVLDASLLPVFGPSADRSVGPVVLALLVMWAAIAPALALFLRRRPSPTKEKTANAAATALFWVAGLCAGAVAVGFVLPPGS
jgi:hypothetical protein